MTDKIDFSVTELLIDDGDAVIPVTTGDDLAIWHHDRDNRTIKYDDWFIDNHTRAWFASVGVLNYAMTVGDSDEGMETVISDFLGDLMHLCDGLNLDLDDLLAQAATHHRAEIRGEI